MTSKHKSLPLVLTALLILFCGVLPLVAQTVISDDFTNSTKSFDPWICTDPSGTITMMIGKQLSVDDQGSIGPQDCSPSVAVGDLNGDGLPDLMVADSRGFFWYLQNHGTKTTPKFTTAELTPIWLGNPCNDPWDEEAIVAKNVVPSIQLVDFQGNGILDVVAGTFEGKLYRIRNSGSAKVPIFKTSRNLDDIAVPTHTKGLLWCNYLTPFLFPWAHGGTLDLIMGEGSYSANSIYLLTNQGTNDRPIFNEQNIAKIISGMGRERLAPQVISWNGDGKPDILSVEREGFVNLFLNQSSPSNNPSPPTFDQGRQISIADQNKLEERSTVSVVNLTNSGLPELIIGKTDGHIYLSQNVGQSNDYKFGPLVALTANPNKKLPILIPTNWTLNGGFGSPYDLLVCTNSEVEPGFSPPPDTDITSALRFYIDEPLIPNPTFPEHYYPALDMRTINYDPGVNLSGGTTYKLSFWERTDGDITNFKYQFYGAQVDSSGVKYPDINIEGDVDTSNSWEHFETRINFTSLTDDEHGNMGCFFRFKFNGKGSIYIAALKIEVMQ